MGHFETGTGTGEREMHDFLHSANLLLPPGQSVTLPIINSAQLVGCSSNDLSSLAGKVSFVNYSTMVNSVQEHCLPPPLSASPSSGQSSVLLDISCIEHPPSQSVARARAPPRRSLLPIPIRNIPGSLMPAFEY